MTVPPDASASGGLPKPPLRDTTTTTMKGTTMTNLDFATTAINAARTATEPADSAAAIKQAIRALTDHLIEHHPMNAPDEFAYGITANNIRTQAGQNPSYTQAAVDYINNLDNATLLDAFDVSNDLVEAVDMALSDTLDTLFQRAGIDPEKYNDDQASDNKDGD